MDMGQNSCNTSIFMFQSRFYLTDYVHDIGGSFSRRFVPFVVLFIQEKKNYRNSLSNYRLSWEISYIIFILKTSRLNCNRTSNKYMYDGHILY
jgi:hypothetical protein